MNDNENLEIEITGKIDLTKSDAYDNGLIEGEGVGEMQMTLKAGRQVIMRVTLHKLVFKGTKSATNPDCYPDSSEK